MNKNELINLCDSIVNRCDTIQVHGQNLLDILDEMIAAEKAALEKSLAED